MQHRPTTSRRRRRIRAWVIAVAVLSLGACGSILALRFGPVEAAPATTAPATPRPIATAPSGGDVRVKPASPQPSTTAGGGSPIDDPNSYEVVVDKKRPLHPLDFVPSDLVRVTVPYIGQAPVLRSTAAAAVEALFAAFHAETGLGMQSNSAYRSYVSQQAEVAKFTGSLGRTEALETTALPGYSEHQTGLAIDVGATGSSCTKRDCFASTPQAHWLATNAWRFGFIIRYPQGEQAITGYSYEPWHLRYVGPALAKKIHGHYPSLESYFHLAAAPTY